MALPLRISRKDGYTAPLEPLLANHQIGLTLDADYRYDMATRKGARTTGGDSKKISNYALLAPYGAHSQKIFLHGKDLLSEAQAKAIFEQHASVDSLTFSDEAMAKASWAFRPESLTGRTYNYVLRTHPSEEERLAMELEAMKEHFTHIDFSTFPPKGTLTAHEHISRFMSFLEDAGQPIAEVIYAQQQGKDPGFYYNQRRMLREVPPAIDTFLAQPKDEAQKAMCDRLGGPLRAYAAAHGWDWEILENFKAGIRAPVSPSAALEEVLEAGILIRSKALLREAVGQIANPYSEPFTSAERGMAHVIKDSLQPRTLDVLRREKTPLVFFNDTHLTHAGTIMGDPSPAVGSYLHASPQGHGFSDFIMLGMENQKVPFPMQLRHETEHWLESQSGVYFIEMYKGKIADMATSDVAKIRQVFTFVSKIKADSPDEHKEYLFKLGRKRGLRIQPHELESFRDELLKDINSVFQKSAIFLPVNPSNATYAQLSMRYVEIPAVVEECKAAFGQTFVAELMPQLAKATHDHRAAAYAAIEARQPVVREAGNKR